MKNSFLAFFSTCILLFFASCLPIKAQTRALQPVCGDSLILDDFFWNGILNTISEKQPHVKPHQYNVEEKLLKKIPKLDEKWRRAVQEMSLTGAPAGMEGTDKGAEAAMKIAEQSSRLALLTRKSKYVDVLERALYNEIASAYLDSLDSHKRLQAAEMLKGVRQLCLATSDKNIYLNFLLRGDAHVKTDDLDFKIRIVGSMPWYNQMMLVIYTEKENQHMSLHLRVPNWFGKAELLPGYKTTVKGRNKLTMSLNGLEQIVEVDKDGYVVIERDWNDKDVVHFLLPTPILRVSTTNQAGKIALQRGALIYNFETLPEKAKVKSSDLIGNVFQPEAHQMILSAPYYDATGQTLGRYSALPFPFHRAYGRQHLWADEQ